MGLCPLWQLKEVHGLLCVNHSRACHRWGRLDQAKADAERYGPLPTVSPVVKRSEGRGHLFFIPSNLMSITKSKKIGTRHDVFFVFLQQSRAA